MSNQIYKAAQENKHRTTILQGNYVFSSNDTIPASLKTTYKEHICYSHNLPTYLLFTSQMTQQNLLIVM